MTEPSRPEADDDLPPLPDLEDYGFLRERPTRLADTLEPYLDAAPGLTRVAANAWLHTAEWGVRSGARTGLRFLRAVRDPGEALALARDATTIASAVGGVARAVSNGTSLPRALYEAGELISGPERAPGRQMAAVERALTPEEKLRQQGAELLKRSRDVWHDEESHPAFARILGELAPDEARILVLLLHSGPQPSVDVRTGGPLGALGGHQIAGGLTMIGARAGLRHLETVPAYMNNLFRLGLIWLSRDPVSDPMEYQVLEAQPDVLDALHSVRFAKPVRRSIHLTPFGEDFCRTCLVDEETAAADFPEHDSPVEDAGTETK